MGFHFQIWTDDRIELLKTRWAEGYSASLIAAELGGVSRNAVCGKVHRLGLPGRRERELPRVHKPRANNPTTGKRKHRKSAHDIFFRPRSPIIEDSLATPLIDDLLIPDEQKKSLLDLKEDTCRWPVGDPSSPGFFFCGGKPEANSPYCAGHHARAYLRLIQPERKQRAYVFRF